MKSLVLILACAVGGHSVCRAEPPAPVFTKIQLSDRFYAEGAYYADFNKDGKLDVVAGPFWYEGPDFQQKHEIRPVQAFEPQNYSDNFLTFTGDFNGDGWPDVLYIPIPSEEAFWYENPAGKEESWRRHSAMKDVGNESPVWGDVNSDGQPELIYNSAGYLGYAVYDAQRPDEPWSYHPITPPRAYDRFTHGIGIGDLNGDGRVDIMEANGWWEQPADASPNEPWIWHPFKFAEAAAQILVYDVDGDGRNDIITAWHCHEYGLVWYKQIRNDTGEITWQQNVILPPNPDLNSDALRISQLHAFELVDINSDGLKDIVTGKRFWAHGPQGDAEPNAPAVVYWLELRRDGVNGAQFIPHLIDSDSGVGTQVSAADLNGDGIPDVIVSNKNGTFLHLSQPSK